MMLVDSHCHLDFPDFEEGLDALLANAAGEGIGHCLTISTRVRKFQQILAIAEAHENVTCTIGTHPHNAAEEVDITLEEIVGPSAHPKVVGIGEAGLDYYYDRSPRDIQEKVFRRHIHAAQETGLPLVIHTRDADEDMAAILEDEMGKGTFNAILHCFSASKWLAQKGLDLGLHISFSGILTFKKSEEIREVAAMAPADRILVETDAPYLAPVPRRGKRNEPAYVRHTAKVLAETRGVSLEDVAAQTTANFFDLFKKAKPPASMTRAA